MPDNEKIKIANDANMIVAGYAYTWFEGNVRVVNLNKVDPNQYHSKIYQETL